MRARKVEANALVNDEAGRQLCRAAILKYLSPKAPAAYQRRLDPLQTEARK